MIKERNTKQASGFHQAGSDRVILRGWFCIAGGMKMGGDYCRGVIDDGLSEDFPGMHESSVDETNGRNTAAYYLMGAVERDDAEQLLLPVPVALYDLVGISR